MCCTKRFRINAHRALKALLFPITKTPEYFSSKYKNQVFSFALLGSHTVETLLGGILQRGKKKKIPQTQRVQLEPNALNTGDFSGIHSTVGVSRPFPPVSIFSLCFIRSIRMN